jgi:cell division protein FtsI/penicillin-binding protein 2
MFNLSNETDYKLLLKTKNYYNFFIFAVLFLFTSIFVRLLFLSFDNNSISSSNERDTSLTALPTIYDLNKNILAYSDYNYSIKNIKNKVKYLKRNVPISVILEPIYKGDPYIKFEKILTRKYPHKAILNNMIGNTNIDHKGISLIEKFIDQNNRDIDISIDIKIQKKIYDSLFKDTLNLNPDYSLNVLVDLSREEIVSNVFLDNRNVDDRFDQTLLPLKDLKFDFGSVFKTFTVYSALKNQKININEYFDVDQPVYIGSKMINDYPRNSEIPMQVGDILKKSSNRGAILIRRNLDCQNEFKADLDQIGLLKSTQIGFGMTSVEPTVNNFRGRYCDNIPFGYGLSISPIQLINAYGKIITGRDNFNASFEKNEKQNKNKYNKISNTVNKLLFYANETDNELYKNFLVAGKTGTADQFITNDEKFQNVTYISFFPYNNPKYLNLTFMQNPKESYGKYMTAGNTVKPTFYNLLKEIYIYLDLSIVNTKSTDI